MLNKMKEKKWFFPTVIGIITLVVLGVGVLIGQGTLRAEADGQAYTYEDLINKTDQAEKELKDLKDEYKSTEIKLNDSKESWQKYDDLFDELKDLKSSKNGMIKKKTELNVEIKELKEKIDGAKKELESLTSGISEAEGDPIVLSAGHYSIGDDLRAGRYKVTPTGGSGNFFVDSDVYEREVGVTLGSGQFSEDSFVFFAVPGDTIRLMTEAKFTPVQ